MLKIVYSLSAVMYTRLSFLNIDIAFFLTVTDSEVITSLINKKGVFDCNCLKLSERLNFREKEHNV